MSATRTRRLSEATTLPEDCSVVLHRFSDGWTVRQPSCRGDLHREGILMGNCWNEIGLVEECGTNLDMLQRFFDEPPAPSRYLPCSLRDPDNLPRCSFTTSVENGILEAHDPLSRHNAEPKPEMIARIAAFVPGPVVSGGALNYRILAA
jgi:hypothetical protein